MQAIRRPGHSSHPLLAQQCPCPFRHNTTTLAHYRLPCATRWSFLVTRGRRGGRIASTAFELAHATWDNAAPNVPRSDQRSRVYEVGRSALATYAGRKSMRALIPASLTRTPAPGAVYR